MKKGLLDSDSKIDIMRERIEKNQCRKISNELKF